MFDKPINRTLFGVPGSLPAYLLGNGINRTENEPLKESWGGLLQFLNLVVANFRVQNISTPTEQTNYPKEYPFVFDEIVLRDNGRINKNEIKARSLLSEYLQNLEPNHRYRGIDNLKATEILTTNFDYRIERALDHEWNRPPFQNTTEKKYSLRRFQIASGRRIWHCHGEQGMKNSLMLGYRHYIDYASEVRNEAKIFLSSRERADERNMDSWVHRFFTTDICICGLGMSYTEYPIWWLLAYREHMLRIKQKQIRNKINFLVLKQDHSQSKRNIFDALRAYQVNVVEIDADDYDSFYKLIFANEWMPFATIID